MCKKKNPDEEEQGQNRVENNLEKVRGIAKLAAFGTVFISFVEILLYAVIVAFFDTATVGDESILITSALAIIFSVILICGIGMESVALCVPYILGMTLISFFYVFKGIVFFNRYLELRNVGAPTGSLPQSTMAIPTPPPEMLGSRNRDDGDDDDDPNERSGRYARHLTIRMVYLTSTGSKINTDGYEEKEHPDFRKIIVLAYGIVRIILFFIFMTFVVIVVKYVAGSSAAKQPTPPKETQEEQIPETFDERNEENDEFIQLDHEHAVIDQATYSSVVHHYSSGGHGHLGHSGHHSEAHPHHNPYLGHSTTPHHPEDHYLHSQNHPHHPDHYLHSHH